MRYYAVLDTNVLVSALLKHGSVPWQVLAEAVHGEIIPVVNEDILSEYEAVLRRPKFRFNPYAVSVFLDDLKKRAVFAEASMLDEQIPDPKDVVFYAVLMEKRKEEEAYLVTGNLRHFPLQPFVVTPKEMLDIVRKG